MTADSVLQIANIWANGNSNRPNFTVSINLSISVFQCLSRLSSLEVFFPRLP